MERKSKIEYVVCIKNDGYSASLEKRKIYQIKSDSVANQKDLLRVIDESGEDYLYPANYFIPIKISSEIQEKAFHPAA